MDIQKEILSQYKQTYPADTYQTISNKTGIQNTRVFRIFNGYEMKLSEYSRFVDVLGADMVSIHSKETKEKEKIGQKVYNFLNKLNPQEFQILERQIDLSLSYQC